MYYTDINMVWTFLLLQFCFRFLCGLDIFAYVVKKGLTKLYICINMNLDIFSLRVTKKKKTYFLFFLYISSDNHYNYTKQTTWLHLL